MKARLWPVGLMFSTCELEDTFLSSPPVSQEITGTPEFWSLCPTLEGATSPTPYATDNLKPLAQEKFSLAGYTRSGASYLPSTPTLLLLREGAGTEGTVRVQVPFSITDL